MHPVALIWNHICILSNNSSLHNKTTQFLKTRTKNFFVPNTHINSPLSHRKYFAPELVQCEKEFRPPENEATNNHPFFGRRRLASKLELCVSYCAVCIMVNEYGLFDCVSGTCSSWSGSSRRFANHLLIKTQGGRHSGKQHYSNESVQNVWLTNSESIWSCRKTLDISIGRLVQSLLLLLLFVSVYSLTLSCCSGAE